MVVEPTEAMPDRRGAIPAPKTENSAAITDPKDAGELFRALDGFKGTFVVRCALLLIQMLFVRPGELRKAMWGGFDLDKGEWRYFITKTKTEHLVPLASQVISTLRELQALTGHGPYVSQATHAMQPSTRRYVAWDTIPRPKSLATVSEQWPEPSWQKNCTKNQN